MLIRTSLLLLALTVLAPASSIGARSTCTIEPEQGRTIEGVVPIGVRNGYLYYTSGVRVDSIEVRDVARVLTESRSHLFGAIAGLGGGALVGAGGAALVVVTAGNTGHGSATPYYALALLTLAPLIGLVLGAASGIDIAVFPSVDLYGMNEQQRTTALQNFILDSELRSRE